nr:trimeric intracellular cation channel family protein [Corynebacterium doosanense]
MTLDFLPQLLDPQQAQPGVQALYRYIDITGVFLMGVVGGTVARRQEYDIIGFFFLALFSALGGGMVRDALIQRGTVAAVASPEYLILAFSGALIAWLFHFRGPLWDRVSAHADAIIAGSWAVTGATKALTFGLPVLSALFMGVLTATGGGMIRDVVTGHRPQVFGGNQLAVIPAVAAAAVCAVFHHSDMQAVGMILGLLVGSGLAIASHWFGWTLGTDPDFAPATMTARQIAHLARSATRRGRKGRSETSKSESPEPEVPDPDYSFEEILRAMHEDETDEGRHNEREFISAWLAWQAR